MPSIFALSRWVFARLGRANHFLCGVEQAPGACSTPHKKSDERRRREQANGMEIRRALGYMEINAMSEEFEYFSHARLVYREGYRYAYLGEVVEPVIYGMQGGLRQYYGAKEGPPVASTLDHIVAAVAG